MSDASPHTPRAYGGQTTCHVTLPVGEGYSPRIRGSNHPNSGDSYLRPILPAHTRGSNRLPLQGHLQTRDTPRAYGGQTARIRGRRRTPRYSPRMRGSNLRDSVDMVVDSILPAHTGVKPSTGSRFRRLLHTPRACGGQTHIDRNTQNNDRYSPRMRGGKPNQLRLTGSNTDTPRACGGQTQDGSVRTLKASYSPRMRGSNLDYIRIPAHGPILPAHTGVKPYQDISLPTSAKYSPLMRGSNQKVRDSIGQRRILPAHTGVKPEELSDGINRTNTPRACGGSNLQPQAILSMVLILPAHAGVKPVQFTSITNSLNTPRACGGQTNHTTLRKEVYEYSPRMRGGGKPVTSVS